MLRNLIFALTCLSLAGCAGAYTNQTHTQLNTAAKRELAAWDTVQTAYDKECPHGSPQKPIAREKALESNQCYEELVKKNVMPVAMDATEVNRFLIANKKAAIEYKKGKIDADEKALQVQENWTNYVAQVDAKGNAVINAAAQKDAQLAQQQQQYFQNLSKQAMQAQQATQQNEIENTNCQFIGNQMQCQTW